MPATRAPLSAADQEYFRKHGIDKALAELVAQLAASKPQDPFKAIADFANQRAAGGSPVAAPAKAVKPAAAAPAAKSAAKPAATAPAAAADDAQIKAKGDEIRVLKEKLKGQGMSGKDRNEHEDIIKLVAELSALKAGAGSTPAAAPKAEAKAKAEPKKEKGAAKSDAKAEPKKEKGSKAMAKASAAPSRGGGLDIKKADDVPGWYEQVIYKAELIESYPVKGCFILRPWAYKIWEQVQGWFDKKIKTLDVENCYFPMFIPKEYMEKEADHLSDFAPELAMVTKIGDRDIECPVAIRPTSETAMYAAYSNWVQSHRDLPLKLNQWCSVVRWEVKQTTPFLRTREFLWQEGHTAHADKPSAEKEVLDILDFYGRIYEELLAVPVIRGTKTKAETFPGADYTTTVEAFIPATGRAIQGATSHHLGQNFSKMFDITFQDPNDPTGKKKEYAYQNSWGFTQRTIGVMTMVHGDDKGLICPPNVAAYQVVIVPVGLKATSSDDDRAKVRAKTYEYYMKLSQAGVRTKLDERDQSPGWKFNYWEMKGVPLRLELGPMDIEKGSFVMAKRNILDQKASKVTGKDATVADDVSRILKEIHEELYSGALAERDSRLASVDEWKDFSPNLNKGKMVLVPFCGDKECEEMIKDKSKEEAAGEETAGGLKMGAKSLCIPHEDKYNVKCPCTCVLPECPSARANNCERRTLFGRSY